MACKFLCLWVASVISGIPQAAALVLLVLWLVLLNDARLFLSESNQITAKEEPHLTRLPFERPTFTLIILLYDKILFEIIYSRVRGGSYPRPGLRYLTVSALLMLAGINRSLIFLATLSLYTWVNGVKPETLFGPLLLKRKPRLLVKEGGKWVANPKIYENLIKLLHHRIPDADPYTKDMIAKRLLKFTEDQNNTEGLLKTNVVMLANGKTPKLHLSVAGVADTDLGTAILTDSRKSSLNKHYGGALIMDDIDLQKKSALLAKFDLIKGQELPPMPDLHFVNATLYGRANPDYLSAAFRKRVLEESAVVNACISDLMGCGLGQDEAVDLVHWTKNLNLPSTAHFPLVKYLGEWPG